MHLGKYLYTLHCKSVLFAGFDVGDAIGGSRELNWSWRSLNHVHRLSYNYLRN